MAKDIAFNLNFGYKEELGFWVGVFVFKLLEYMFVFYLPFGSLYEQIMIWSIFAQFNIIT